MKFQGNIFIKEKSIIFFNKNIFKNKKNQIRTKIRRRIFENVQRLFRT